MGVRMRFVLLALFILFSAVHLYGSFLDNKTIRNYTKGGILLCLTGYYICSASPFSWLVVAALLFSWLGDVLLMFKMKGFIAGGVSFMVSHVIFILAYLPHIRFSAIGWLLPALVAAVYALAVTLVFRALKPYLSKAMFYPMMLYLFINGAMNWFAFLLLLSSPTMATALVFIGAVMFFISDSTLFFVRFHKEKLVWKKHFIVMLTYILAEYLIVQGLLLIG